MLRSQDVASQVLAGVRWDLLEGLVRLADDAGLLGDDAGLLGDVSLGGVVLLADVSLGGVVLLGDVSLGDVALLGDVARLGDVALMGDVILLGDGRLLGVSGCTSKSGPSLEAVGFTMRSALDLAVVGCPR